MRPYHYCGALIAAVTLSMAAGACAQTAAPEPASAMQPLAPGTSGGSVPPPTLLPKELRGAERQNRDGQHQAALTAVEAFLKDHPDDSGARFLRGVILTDMGRNQDAIRVFTMLTVDHPELEQPYNNLGVLYAQAGELQLARRSLEQAVEADPQNAVALENLGDIYARLALDTYQRALVVDTKNRSVRSKLILARNLAEKTPSMAAPPAVTSSTGTPGAASAGATPPAASGSGTDGKAAPAGAARDR